MKHSLFQLAIGRTWIYVELLVYSTNCFHMQVL
jgi:hypothetical protein